MNSISYIQEYLKRKTLKKLLVDIDATKEDQKFKTFQNYDLCPNGNHQDRGFILRTSGWPFLKYSDGYFSHLVEPKEDEGFVYLTPVKPGEKPEVVFFLISNRSSNWFFIRFMEN